MKIIQSDFIALNAKIAILTTHVNNFINENLLRNSIDTLIRIGKIKKDNITIIKVPGSQELPLITNIIVKSKKYDAIIVLGSIIKGKTMHFELLATSVTNEISNISIQNNIPITLGLITAENVIQAIDRSGTKYGNKGHDAALACLELINIINKINKL
ncbi:6,7-dimethyl-8-ribityllumazine synthase [Buchnera aphidicola (Neophyllaphis podocarpi)]|uniref:6,7-dimethyl-8-ribityllumazine synthase n=1 Tax=Buchnera aphidicola TaxID=9 RepID=UPI0031B83E2A